MSKLMRELVALQRSPPSGVRLARETADGDAGAIAAWIRGEDGTPYEGGYFKVRFSMPSDYPASPPKAWFVTRIFHPNVNPSDGEICVNTLKKDWKPEMGLSHVLTVIKCLLIHPGPDSALNAEAGHLLLESFESFCARARLHTSIHARVRPAEFPAEEEEGRARPLAESGRANEETSGKKRGAEVEEKEQSGSTPAPVKKTVAPAAKKRGLKRL